MVICLCAFRICCFTQCHRRITCQEKLRCVGYKTGRRSTMNMQVHRFVLSLKCAMIKRTSTYFVDLFIYCVYVCGFAHAVGKVWEPKDNMQNSIFSFPRMDAEVWTRSSGVTAGILPLSCLTNQIYKNRLFPVLKIYAFILFYDRSNGMLSCVFLGEFH